MWIQGTVISPGPWSSVLRGASLARVTVALAAVLNSSVMVLLHV